MYFLSMLFDCIFWGFQSSVKYIDVAYAVKSLIAAHSRMH